MRRQCSVCGKRLSTYNKESICFCHQNMPKFEYAPVTLCGGWLIAEHFKSTGGPRHHSSGFPNPGDSNYNNIAFSKVKIEEE